MPGIYDLFRIAAEGAEKLPVGYRVVAGAVAGGAADVAWGDKDTPFMDKLAQGMFAGGIAGGGVGFALRGAGKATEAAFSMGKSAVTSKAAQVQKIGYKAFMKPGTLMLGGAVAGAALAPSGHKTQGAMLGAGLGLAYKPAMGIIKGFNTLEHIPGAQTTALIAAATVPVVAAGIFGSGTPDASGGAVPGIGGTMDYTPLEGGMKDRMVAMNASGEVVLGLNGRRHG